MNELFFNWRKSLNLKKLIITILILLIIIVIILISIFYKKEPVENSPSAPIYNDKTNTTTFFDTNCKISLEIPNKYNLKQFKTSQDYLLELRSESNLSIFISSKDKIPSRHLKDVVFADKESFTENFFAVSNVSDVKELNINESTHYSYSFNYIDENLNQSFYIQIFWIETNDNYYVFDIEFPLDNLNNYPDIANDIINNFQILD